jgi:hypothetical protein
VATSPLTDFGFPNPLLPDTPALKLAELVRLQKFAQRITSTLDIEELVPRIVDEVAASLGCVEINIFLRDPEAPEFVLAGVRGCTVHGKGHRILALSDKSPIRILPGAPLKRTGPSPQKFRPFAPSPPRVR